MAAYRSNREHIEALMQERWDGASIFARFWLWLDGCRPHGAGWLA